MYVLDTIRNSAIAFLEKEHPKHAGRISVNYDDLGGSHIKGAWKDQARASIGITKEYVDAFRRELRQKTRISLPFEEADNLLQEANDARIRGTMSSMTTADNAERRREYERTKKARRRQWARENGYCIICCKNAASYSPKDGSNNVTCIDCQAKANAKKKAR